VKPNVFIRARRRGKLCYLWEGHNTWTAHGRQYLATLFAYASYGPDTPVTASSRIKHMQFGVGSKTHGSLIGAVNTAYPAGADPNATTGDKYDHNYPEAPSISTLERPVRFAGGTNPYGTAAPTDTWLSTPALPKFFTDFSVLGQVSITCFLDATAGDMIYSTFTAMPLSEAGLVVSGDANIHTPFNPVITYVNFDPVQLMNEVEAEITWVVGS
jgi:hypothetical protein